MDSDIFNGPAHGENVSFGYNSARGTVIGYIGETYNISETSPLGHRENIFNDNFRSIGVGITELYSVQQFKF